ncbi:MAG TPA: long-chain fatty acid--CoA ligase [Anaerolineales bacterium]|nr:long-chain fatty acid--CoA ligase [Anaerolineales bacterium]
MQSQPWLEFYDPGVPANLTYPDIPVFHFLDEAARRFPERPCTIFKEAVTTYREMGLATDRLAGALSGLGVRRGDRVGLFLPNVPQFVLAYFAILKAGGVVVATNPSYTPPEIEHQVNDASLQVMFVMGTAYGKLKAVQPRTGIRTLIVAGADEPATLEAGDARLEELLALSVPRPDLVIGPDDTALFQYSGGTTGISKAAVALHRNLVANTLQFKAWMVGLEAGRETALLAIPMYHVYGMVCGMSLSMALGASLLLIPNPRDLNDLLAGVQKYHPTYFPAVPTLYNAINNHPDVQAGKVDLSSIKACISGSAPLMKETKEKFEALTGGKICEGYGLSEAPTATHCNPLLGPNKIGSIGLPLPDVDCRIVDVEGGQADLPTGEVGELLLRGPQVMKGYHRMPEETALTLQDGWLHTGDLARMDAEGYFYIIDRKKELIKPDGLQVWPREVEEAISAHPKVQEVGVAGVPDEYHGEAVKAWVVVRPGERLGEEEVRAWCQDRLAPYKIPSRVEFRSELPKTNVGKVLRRELVREDKEKNKK